tara:strand:+ start:3065 stop:3181 length:117 start_codon:yes stop_codon:yes gene_type:complete
MDNALLYLFFLSMGGITIFMVLLLIALMVYSIQDWREK